MASIWKTEAVEHPSPNALTRAADVSTTRTMQETAHRTMYLRGATKIDANWRTR